VRVLLDTNVIVSAVTTRGLCADVFRAVLSAHQLVTCAQVIQEVRRILRIKFGVPEPLIAEYLELIGQEAIMAESEDLPDLPIQDQDDAEIVAAAIAAGAQVLVTGDHELQSLKNIGKVRILSPRAFWEELTVHKKVRENNKMDIESLDFRLIEVESEVFALDYYLKLIEQQIRNKEAWERRLSQKRIKKHSLTYDDPEYHFEQQELDYLLEVALPRLFRGPFLISLYAVYESSVTDIALLIQKQKAIQISINDLKGDFLERAKKYFKDVIKFKLFSGNEVWQRISMLFEIRNAIAYTNGRIEMLNKKTREKIVIWEKQKVGISSNSGYLVVEELFLRDTFRVVSDFLNDLVQRYKEWDNKNLPGTMDRPAGEVGY
jgi:uncharacterized protein